MKWVKRLRFLLFGLICLAIACGGGEACPQGQVACGEVCIDPPASDAHSLADDLLAPSCAFSACHGGNYPKEDLDLTSAEALRAVVGQPSVQDPSRSLVGAGDPTLSYLVDKLRGRDITALDSLGNEATVMPPDQALCEVRIAAVEAWIEAGAQ